MKAKPNPGPDVRVTDAGSFFLFFPVNDRASDWIETHTDPENRTFYAGGIVVERRYAVDFAVAMREDGLAVK